MSGRWQIVLLLMGFAALGHFNRVGISVVGSEVLIPKIGISETNMGWGLLSVSHCVFNRNAAGWLADRSSRLR